MRYIFVLLALVSLRLSAQNPVQMQVRFEKRSERQYEYRAQVQVEKGWHVYAAPDTRLGLEAPLIQVITPSASIENPVVEGQPTLLHDPIFQYHPLKVYTGNFILHGLASFPGPPPAEATIQLSGFAASDSNEFLPLNLQQSIHLNGAPVTSSKLSSIDLGHPLSDCGSGEIGGNKGWLMIFLLGFGGGLLALLTPCVFPMIPVTVSYFTNRKATTKSAGGLWYGLSIFLIYVLASVPFHLMDGLNPQILNTIATSAGLNLFFFLVFLFFSLSFFGLFEMRLPASVNNAAGSRAGIFFMALTLAVVSFSCTGPILGSLLVGSISSNGGAWQLTAGMGGFGLALALPFTLFAVFPQWLKRLPKSGQWMNTVKKVLAFVELALAFKFLSNADLVEHWGLLKREVFIGIWMLISIGLAYYLFNIPWYVRYGKIRVSNGRIALGLLTVMFILYLTPGLTQGNELKLLSGFPPPLSYSLYDHNLPSANSESATVTVVNDLNKAFELSRQQHKPILINFTGWACVNCRKMEENVWSKPEIKKLLSENFILVSLYVDDRKNLPEGGTMGEKWAKFEEDNFMQVSQPLYAIIGTDAKLLNHPVGYTPDVREYRQWLECGLSAEKN